VVILIVVEILLSLYDIVLKLNKSALLLGRFLLDIRSYPLNPTNTTAGAPTTRIASTSPALGLPL